MVSDTWSSSSLVNATISKKLQATSAALLRWSSHKFKAGHHQLSLLQQQLQHFQLGASSAPGPDGLNGLFYHHHWDILQEDVYRMVHTFFSSGVLPAEINRTSISLIPKTPNPLTRLSWGNRHGDCSKILHLCGAVSLKVCTFLSKPSGMLTEVIDLPGVG